MSDKYVFNLSRALAEICLGSGDMARAREAGEEAPARFKECVQGYLQDVNGTLFKTHFYNRFKLTEQSEERLPSINVWFAEDD